MLKLNNCPLCNDFQIHSIVKGRDYLDNVQGIWNYDKCERCHYVFLNPRPKKEDLWKLYNPEKSKLHYHKKIESLGVSGFRNIFEKIAFYYNLKNFRNDNSNILINLLGYLKATSLKIQLFPVFTTVESKILEIGSGNGNFLRELKRLGYKNIYATDFNEETARELEKKFSVKVWSDDFRNIPELQSIKYNYIAASMVLEHVDDPKGFIDVTYDILEKDGVFAFSVPCFDGVEFKIFKEYSYGLQPPFHLSQFSIKNLKMLLARFKKVEFYFHRFDRDWVSSAEVMYKEKPGLLSLVLNIGQIRILRRLLVKPMIVILSFFRRTSRVSIYAYK